MALEEAYGDTCNDDGEHFCAKIKSHDELFYVSTKDRFVFKIPQEIDSFLGEFIYFSVFKAAI
jgi:hypothetical protein